MSGGISGDDSKIVIVPTSAGRSLFAANLALASLAPTCIDFESGMPKGDLGRHVYHDYMYDNNSGPVPYSVPDNIKAIRAKRKAKKKMRKASRRK